MGGEEEAEEKEDTEGADEEDEGPASGHFSKRSCYCETSRLRCGVSSWYAKCE